MVEVLLGVEVRHGVDALGRGVETSAERGSSWAVIDRLGRCEESVEVSRSLAGCDRHVVVVCTAGRDGGGRRVCRWPCNWMTFGRRRLAMRNLLLLTRRCERAKQHGWNTDS